MNAKYEGGREPGQPTVDIESELRQWNRQQLDQLDGALYALAVAVDTLVKNGAEHREGNIRMRALQVVEACIRYSKSSSTSVLLAEAVLRKMGVTLDARVTAARERYESVDSPAGTHLPVSTLLNLTRKLLAEKLQEEGK